MYHICIVNWIVYSLLTIRGVAHYVTHLYLFQKMGVRYGAINDNGGEKDDDDDVSENEENASENIIVMMSRHKSSLLGK